MPEPAESETTRHRTPADPTADRVIAFLRGQGADRHGHGAGRSLLDHLRETYEIAGRWEQPSWLRHAALIHSVYGTEAHRRQLIPLTRRAEVSAVAGERAERLAHLFAVTPRRRLVRETHGWAPGLHSEPGDRAGVASATAPATRDELDALVLLHLANLAEQARAADGSPGAWLVQLRELAEVVFDSGAVTLPLFVATLAGSSRADETACRTAYREGLAETDPALRAERLALAAATCPVVGEPCVWLARAARGRGDLEAARAWAHTAQRRLRGLGTAWDKRLRFDEWLTVTSALLAGGPGEGGEARDGGTPGRRGSAIPTDPRALYEEVAGRSGSADPAALPVTPPEPAAATARFQRYMSRLADAVTPAGRLRYPDLDCRPWWEPSAFAPAIELESHFEEIRAEILALAGSRFAPESERIPRTGDWDVVFLYERGRRHEEVCDACPATTRVIEGDGAMRTAAGLIYVSRLRPGTHIAAHRGPTNLRLRCHLGIAVPDGDCAIRVDDRSRPWREGGCLVFDDSFEHEAWNHTGEDRIVLIVDLWHPGLSSTEIRLLTGLQRYAEGYGRRLDRYWSVNAAARRGQSGS